MKCKLFGHKFEPYEYYWTELMPRELKPIYNRDGFKRLTKVYCTRCGAIRKIMFTEKGIRYVE